MKPGVEAVENGFLDGKLRILQPKEGYRAATDPVLLAACTPVTPAQSVLDLGCGVGTASLCLEHRMPGIEVHGLEKQAEYTVLARRNAELNGTRMQVHDGDVLQMPPELRQRGFDVVMTNPPWHDETSFASPIPGRDLANRMADMTLSLWITAAFTRLLPGGWFVMIQRAAWLPEILSALGTRAGHIAVLPLQAREGRDAKRVIVKARKGTQGPFRIAPPLVLHTGSTHVEDRDDHTPIARAILRDGAGFDY